MGAGSYGVVVKAIKCGKIYALKTMSSKPGLDLAAQVRLFCHEWAILRTISHPRIPQCFDLFRLGAEYFLTQEYIPGTPLSTLLLKGYTFSEHEIKHIVMQLLEILVDLHAQGIVHRDLRLSNLILHKGSLYIVDFGFARKFNAASGRQHCLPPDPPIAGASSSYLALRRAISPSSDLFAVGLVAVDLAANWQDTGLQASALPDSPFLGKFVKTLLQTPGSIPSAHAAMEILRPLL